MSGVTLSTPQSGSVSASQLTQMIKVRAEAVKVPGVALIPAEVGRYGVGPTTKYPVGAGMIDSSFTFLCDKYGGLWNLWYQWLLATVQFAGTNNSSTGAFNQPASYLIQYRDQYTTTMTINVYSQTGAAVQVIQLIDAYPISFNEMQLDWMSRDMVRITVGISYKEVTIQGAGTTAAGTIAGTPTIPTTTVPVYNQSPATTTTLNNLGIPQAPLS